MAAKAVQRQKAAVFIDAENHADLQVYPLLHKLEQFEIVERQAHADWRNRCLDPLAERLERHGFRLQHAMSGRSPGVLKNTADGHMAKSIRETLAVRPEIDVVVIVSGDEFFVDAIQELRERGKRVIVASAPCRVSRNLCRLADHYIPLGEMSYWLRDLYHLEQTSAYLTFRYTVQRLGIRPSDLSNLIRKRVVIQEEISRPGRGIRPEIRLNPEAHPVQAVLGAP